MDLPLGFLFFPIGLYFCLCASIILSWWLWLCSRAWSPAGWFHPFHSSFSGLLWLFEVFLYFHTNYEIICSSSVKNTTGSLIEIALNLLIALGSILIFTIYCLQETHLKTGDTHRLKVKGWKKIFHANRDQKKAGVAILISDKIDFIYFILFF